MARRITGIGIGAIKHAPWLAIILAIYQYYRGAGGFQGFLSDIKNLNMDTLRARWINIAIGATFFVGADVIGRYVPGNTKYIVKAVMYYFGASQFLDVLQGMYIEQGQGASMNGTPGVSTL